MERIVNGALAGLLATAPMSAVIAAGRATGLLYVPPPAQITASVEERSGVSDQLPNEGFTARWVGAHFAYGAFLGALYALLRPALPGRATPVGLVFGLVIWALNYLGAMPALGLYPWPKDDRNSRALVMVAAHLVFGAGVALFYTLMPARGDEKRRGPLDRITRA